LTPPKPLIAASRWRAPRLILAQNRMAYCPSDHKEGSVAVIISHPEAVACLSNGASCWRAIQGAQVFQELADVARAKGIILTSTIEALIFAAPHTPYERELMGLWHFGQISGVEAFMAQMDRTFSAAMFGSLLPENPSCVIDVIMFKGTPVN
jgi:hypothetical protein